MRLRQTVLAKDVPAYLPLHMRRNRHSGEADVRKIDELVRLAEQLRVAWEDETDALIAENLKLQTKIDELEAEAISFDLDANRLHDAICEGRRQDAIDILNDVTGGCYRSLADQRNLFPDRVPA